MDSSLLRLISKWLHAGVLDDGQLLTTDVGTAQGSVISPILSNIYLHYVLDEWWEKEVVPRLRGRGELVRYADDWLLAFEYQEDAERVYQVVGKRLDRYGLQLHPEKTRLLHFDSGQARKSKDEGVQPPTFNFLGFQHYFGKSRRGNLTYRIRTIGKRLSRSLKAIGLWCRKNRHRLVRQQWETLSQKLRGHYEYYGRSMNFRCLRQFYRGTLRLRHKWLSRRHGREPLSWEKFKLLLTRFPLPRPRITHALFPTTR